MSICLNTVKSEIHNVLSTIRLSQKNDLPKETPLVRNLKTLHETLLTVNHLEEVDAPVFLSPFLEVIRTSHNPIVLGVALSSMNKFLLYGSLEEISPRAGEAVNLSVQAVCVCYSNISDEIISLQLLEVLVSLLRCAVGKQLTEANTWAIVNTAYELAVNKKLSELLRVSAANQLSHIMLLIFSRSQSHHCLLLGKILHFLSNLPPDQRTMGLQLINICLETGGDTLSESPETTGVIQNDLFNSLLLNSQSSNLAVFGLTLRVVYNLFSKSHSLKLKIQLETFLTSVHFRICSLTDRNVLRRELAMESLLDFCHDSALVLNLFANYDCDVQHSNLFEGLIKLLVKRCLTFQEHEHEEESEHVDLSSLQMLALEGIFAIVSSLEARCNPSLLSSSPLLSEEFQNAEENWLIKHSHKRKLLLAIGHFNKNFKDPYWVEYAKELGLIQENDDDTSHFLFSAGNVIDKEALGEFLSESTNKDKLKAYLQHFDFHHLRIDEALRKMLTCFRIPGEAQKIERVMEAFASRYFEQQENGLFCNADAVFIFAFSIIMLHTDRHSRSIPENKRMTLDQFVRNVRGINAGKDFPPEFLSLVFTSVSEREFLLTASSSSSNSPPRPAPLQTEKKETTTMTTTTTPARFLHHVTPHTVGGPQERRMFEIIFESFLTVMDTTLPLANAKVGMSLLRCARHLATIAHYFSMAEEVNLLLITLCNRFFQMFPLVLQTVVSGQEEVFQEESLVFQSIFVARLILEILTQQENATAAGLVREAWANIVLMLCMLMHHGFLLFISQDEVLLQAEQGVLDTYRKSHGFENKTPANEIIPPITPTKSTTTTTTSMWSTFRGFFVDDDDDDEEDEEKERLALKQQEVNKKKEAITRSIRTYLSGEHDILFCMTSLDANAEATHHLITALCGPFHTTPPLVWSKEETQRSTLLLGSLLTLVVLLCEKKHDFLSPLVVDECFHFVFQQSDSVDLHRVALPLFFRVCKVLPEDKDPSIHYPHSWSDLLSTKMDATFYLDQSVSWMHRKAWFQLLQGQDTSFGAHVLTVCENHLAHTLGKEEEDIVSLIHVVNAWIMVANTQPYIAKRAVVFFQRIQVSTMGESVWLLALGTLKCYWEDQAVEKEVLESLVHLLFMRTELSLQVAQDCLDTILFPLVRRSPALTSPPKSGSQAEVLLARFVLVAHAAIVEREEAERFVTTNLDVALSALGANLSLHKEDDRICVVHHVLNLLHVLVFKTEFEDIRLARIGDKLDGILPPQWQQQQRKE